MFQNKTSRAVAAAFLLSAVLTPNLAFGQMPPVAAAKTVDLNNPIERIKDEGMNRSQAMATMRYLTDSIGARLTNSPQQKRANEWTKTQMAQWGIQNARVEPWGNFGRGWELKSFSAMVNEPNLMILRAYPKAWTPGTNGALTADVVFFDPKDDAELEKYRGNLKGKIVLMSTLREVKPGFVPSAARRDAQNLLDLADAGAQSNAPQFQVTDEMRRAAVFNARKFRFLVEENAAMLVEPSLGVDAGTIRVMGASLPQAEQVPGAAPTAAPRIYDVNAPKTISQIVVETEQYNRLVRKSKDNAALKMTVDLNVKFYDNDLQGYNTIAEIPGTDLKDEVVMIGAHLDSWHAGTGATDNGAGVTVVMEAIRILQASGLKPRRTIRVGLWTGEEQGLLGSRGYVAKELAQIGDGTPGATNRQMMNGGNKLQVTKKAGYDKFAAYYNLDNGTGKIRGVYMQGNENLRPIFREWLAPFREMGASTLTVASTGGTDHLAFDVVGLPGFQFIQDPIEYTTRTWHTTQDVYDRIIEDDLKQSSIIMATFAFNSAMSDEKLPRKNNPLLELRAMFKTGDNQTAADELAFRNSNLNFAICGHELTPTEIPNSFPSVLAVDTNQQVLGE